MLIFTEITMDLQRPTAPKVIHAKQGDKLTRGVTIKLYSNGVEWPVPDEVTDFFVAFCKPDGKGGEYNIMPDGTTAACTKNGNAIIARFAPQVLTCAGKVRVDIKMVNADGDALKTFGFFVQVEEDAVSGVTSEDYYNTYTLDDARADIGDLDNLTTSKKESLVVAINEVAGNADQATTAAGNAATAAATAKQTADQATTAAGNAATAAATAQQTADNAATAAGNAATAAATAQQTADNAATAAGNAATAAATAQQTADQAATAAGNAATAAATAQQTADNAATAAGKAATAAANTVKYTAQNLSDSQKEQARKNIGAPEMGVTDVTPEWLAWCDDNGIADADCTEDDVFSFLKTLSSGIYCLTTGFFGQVWALIYVVYAKRLVAVIEGRVYVGGDTVISDIGIIAHGGKSAKITDIADSVYVDVTSSYEATNTSGTLTPAEYVKSMAKDGRYRIRIGSIGDALFEMMTVDGSKWLFGRSTDGVSVSYTIDRDDTTVLSMSTAGTAKIGDKTVLTDAVIAIPTSADAGKVLTVAADGSMVWQ